MEGSPPTTIVGIGFHQHEVDRMRGIGDAIESEDSTQSNGVSTRAIKNDMGDDAMEREECRPAHN